MSARGVPPKAGASPVGENGGAGRASSPGSAAVPEAEERGEGPVPGSAPEPGGAVAPLAPGENGGAAPQVAREGEVLRFSGRLTSLTAGPVWRRALKMAEGARRIDLSGLETLDTSGAALVMAAQDAAKGAARDAGHGAPPPQGGGAEGRDAEISVEGASRAVAAVLERSRGAVRAPAKPQAPPRRLGLVRSVGAWGVGRIGSLGDSAAFVGEASATVVNAARRPRDLRVADVLRHLDEVGTRAFGLTVLLGVLIGVILAFQSSIPMRQFGAEIFIPRLVGISLLRELGPLLAGVVLAGRTGSAYAAELGTMTVNEEVSALRIMGIDPMVLLVLPRMVAATVAMPVLALLMDLAGLVGMGGVMLSLGFPVQLVLNQLQIGISMGDLLGGLGKAAVFGLVIAGIGCRAGLSAGSGPRAVGDAATAAVVGGIVALVVLDGIFAVLFFRLGW